jgi:hypothetical protein
MRMGLGLPGTRATAGGTGRCFGSVGALLLGLCVSACVGSGQIANLGETARPSIALESIDGPPAAVVPRLASALKEEAVRNHIAVGAPGEVNYRLHGYFAARSEAADAGATASAMGPATTSMAWTLDLYDGDAHRVVRLSGEEKAGDRLGAAADEQLLRRVARAGMDQVAAFLATSRAPPAGAAAPSPPRTAGGGGWLDDWTPEASGIFRIFGRELSRPAPVAEAKVDAPADDVPLPRGRPAPADAPSSAAIALATAAPAENSR